jgi:hypothetical protein
LALGLGVPGLARPLEPEVVLSWEVRAAHRQVASLQRLCSPGMIWRMCSVCTLREIRCPVWPPPHRPGLSRPHRPQGLHRLHRQGLSHHRADRLSRDVVKAIAIGPALWRWRGWSNGSPAPRALLDIRIVPLGLLAVVPVRRSRRKRVWCLGSRLHIDRRRGRHDSRWIVGIRRPVGSPIRPKGDNNTWPNKDTPAVPCVPWYRARHEQCPHDPEDCQPLPSSRSGLMLVVHGISLFSSSVQALWYTPSLVYHHTPDDSDLATTARGWQTDHHCLTRESASRGRKIPE